MHENTLLNFDSLKCKNILCSWMHHTYLRLQHKNIDGILPKGPYPPCLRMADRALLAGYPRHPLCSLRTWETYCHRPKAACMNNVFQCFSHLPNFYFRRMPKVMVSSLLVGPSVRLFVCLSACLPVYTWMDVHRIFRIDRIRRKEVPNHLLAQGGVRRGRGRGVCMCGFWVLWINALRH